MATRIKKLIGNTIGMIHELSIDFARMLYEKQQDYSIRQTTIVIVIFTIFYLFTICFFSVSSLCMIFFSICGVSAALLYCVLFIGYMICIMFRWKLVE